MKTGVFKVAVLLFVSVFAFLSAGDISAGSGAIKARMAKRLPALQALKAKGIIGENNSGYLEYRTSSSEGKGLVNAENADRKKVYEAIARQQKTTADLVGKLRAKQIAARADKGVWLQKPDGSWYKK